MRYFFDIQSLELSTPDSEGRHFDSPQKMQAEAMRVLAAIACDEGAAPSRSIFVLTVRNDQGREVYRVRANFEAEVLPPG